MVEGRGAAPKRRVVAIINAGGNGRWLPERLVASGVDCVHVRTPEIRGAIGESVDFLGCDAPPFLAGYELGPRGVPGIVPQLRDLGVDMVIAGSEGGVDVATVLAEALGVVGSGPSTPGLCRDKGAMTRRVAEAGLATLPFRLCRAADEIRDWWHEALRCQPVVVKVLRNSSGAGVLFCDDWRSIEDAVRSLVGSTDLYGGENAEVMVQQRASRGDRIWEVCTVSAGGRHRIAMVIESVKDGAAYECMRVLHRSEVGALGPQLRYAEQVLDALTIRHGAAFVEIAVEEGLGPVLIECNARLIGALSPELCRAVLGEAQVDLLARACADPERFAAAPASSAGAARHGRLVHLRCDVDGFVRDLGELRRGLESLPTLFNYRVASEVGASLSPTVDLRTTPGSVQLVGESALEVAADHRRIRAMEADGVYARAVGIDPPTARSARPRAPSSGAER